ncbi:MAG: DUF3105 domain-containing protein [Trueperaceae bacterium]
MSQPKNKQRSQRRRASSKKPSRLPWIVGIAGVVALIVLPIVVNIVQEANKPGERFSSQGNRHISLGTRIPPYNTDPPTSGPHTPGLASWGAYLPGDDVHDEQLVHNMEDGGVVLWYRPGEDEEETSRRVSALQEVARSYQRIAIVPRPEMETRYAFTAWQRLQRFDEIEPEAMRTFIDVFEGIDHHRTGF